MLHAGMEIGPTKMSFAREMSDSSRTNKCAVTSFTKFQFDVVFQGDFFYLMDSGVCEIFKDG
jgi:hypothetical protein